MLTENGFDGDLGGAWLILWDLDTVVDAPSWTEGTDYYEDHPGLLVIGSDGAGERVAFDLRHDPPPIVLVNVVSEGWHQACHQDGSFAEFMARLRAGNPFRFGQADED